MAESPIKADDDANNSDHVEVSATENPIKAKKMKAKDMRRKDLIDKRLMHIY